MAEFLEIIQKHSKVQNDFSQTIEKKGTYAKLENAFIHSEDFEQAVNIMGDTIEDMDIEKEQKDNNIENY